jgi:hypothetical protein
MAKSKKKKEITAAELILLTNNYGFRSDRFCYMLYELGQREGIDVKTKQKTGVLKDYCDVIGYYGTIEAMMEACLFHATRKAADAMGVKQIGDYLDVMRKIKDEIKKAIELTAF